MGGNKVKTRKQRTSPAAESGHIVAVIPVSKQKRDDFPLMSFVIQQRDRLNSEVLSDSEVDTLEEEEIKSAVDNVLNNTSSKENFLNKTECTRTNSNGSKMSAVNNQKSPLQQLQFVVSKNRECEKNLAASASCSDSRQTEVWSPLPIKKEEEYFPGIQQCKGRKKSRSTWKNSLRHEVFSFPKQTVFTEPLLDQAGPVSSNAWHQKSGSALFKKSSVPRDDEQTQLEWALRESVQFSLAGQYASQPKTSSMTEEGLLTHENPQRKLQGNLNKSAQSVEPGDMHLQKRSTEADLMTHENPQRKLQSNLNKSAQSFEPGDMYLQKRSTKADLLTHENPQRKLQSNLNKSAQSFEPGDMYLQKRSTEADLLTHENPQRKLQSNLNKSAQSVEPGDMYLQNRSQPMSRRFSKNKVTNCDLEHNSFGATKVGSDNDNGPQVYKGCNWGDSDNYGQSDERDYEVWDNFESVCEDEPEISGDKNKSSVYKDTKNVNQGNKDSTYEGDSTIVKQHKVSDKCGFSKNRGSGDHATSQDRHYQSRNHEDEPETTDWKITRYDQVRHSKRGTPNTKDILSSHKELERQDASSGKSTKYKKASTSHEVPHREKQREQLIYITPPRREKQSAKSVEGNGWPSSGGNKNIKHVIEQNVSISEHIEKLSAKRPISTNVNNSAPSQYDISPIVKFASTETQPQPRETVSKDHNLTENMKRNIPLNDTHNNKVPFNKTEPETLHEQFSEANIHQSPGIAHDSIGSPDGQISACQKASDNATVQTLLQLIADLNKGSQQALRYGPLPNSYTQTVSNPSVPSLRGLEQLTPHHLENIVRKLHPSEPNQRGEYSQAQIARTEPEFNTWTPPTAKARQMMLNGNTKPIQHFSLHHDDLRTSQFSQLKNLSQTPVYNEFPQETPKLDLLNLTNQTRVPNVTFHSQTRPTTDVVSQHHLPKKLPNVVPVHNLENVDSLQHVQLFQLLNEANAMTAALSTHQGHRTQVEESGDPVLDLVEKINLLCEHLIRAKQKQTTSKMIGTQNETNNDILKVVAAVEQITRSPRVDPVSAGQCRQILQIVLRNQLDGRSKSNINEAIIDMLLTLKDTLIPSTSLPSNDKMPHQPESPKASTLHCLSLEGVPVQDPPEQQPKSEGPLPSSPTWPLQGSPVNEQQYQQRHSNIGRGSFQTFPTYPFIQTPPGMNVLQSIPASGTPMLVPYPPQLNMMNYYQYPQQYAIHPHMYQSNPLTSVAQRPSMNHFLTPSHSVAVSSPQSSPTGSRITSFRNTHPHVLATEFVGGTGQNVMVAHQEDTRQSWKPPGVSGGNRMYPSDL